METPDQDKTDLTKALDQDKAEALEIVVKVVVKIVVKIVDFVPKDKF